jgi:hypothetical protein
VYVGNNPLSITDPTGLDWYFNDKENKYKWFGDKDKIDEGYVLVVGNTGERGSFTYQQEDGSYVTLDPYSKNYLKGIATKEDAVRLADRLYDLTPNIREFANGYNKNYETNITILTVAAAIDVAIVAAPVVADAVATTAASGATTSVATEAETTGATVQRTESVLGHIFRNAEGHVNPGTEASQGRFIRLFERVANSPDNANPNVLSTFQKANPGFRGFSQTFRNGQVWTQVFENRIINAGVNSIPK